MESTISLKSPTRISLLHINVALAINGKSSSAHSAQLATVCFTKCHCDSSKINYMVKQKYNVSLALGDN